MKLPPNKLYVVVDASLSKSQQAVQASHGVAEYMLSQSFMGKYRSDGWWNETLILLKDRDLDKYLPDCDSYWREPDLDNMVTAVAFYTDKFSWDIPLL
jgi:hypothetical protein